MNKLIKIFCVFLALILTLGLFGCAENPPEEESKRAIDYFGFSENSIYHYIYDSGDYKGALHFFDYLDPDKNIYQRRALAGSSVFMELFKYTNGAVTCNLAAYQPSYFHDISNDRFTNTKVLLKEPIVLGNKWERGINYTGKVIDGVDETVTLETEITALDIEIDGYNTIELTTVYGNGDVLIEYLAYGVGLVKSIYTSPEGSVQVTSLTGVDEDTIFMMPFRFFYPGENIGEQLFEERVFEMRTNDSSAEILTNGFKNYIDYAPGAIIDDGVIVNSIAFSHEGRLKIDFNAQPVSGKGIVEEQALMKAIVNTAGYMFNAQNVCITVNGAGYKSENFTLKSDEYMPVNSFTELGMTYEECYDYVEKMDALNPLKGLE